MDFLKVWFANVRNWVIKHKKKIGLVVIILILTFISWLLLTSPKFGQPQAPKLKIFIPTVKPTDTPFTTYKKPKLPKSDRYDIYLVGDSMTHALGPRGGIFTEIVSKEYPGVFFEVSNYSSSNQNILSLPEKLGESVQADRDLRLNPILEGEPDLIIIESFGYNPLSHLGTGDGLRKQEEALTQVMTTLTNRFPNTVIIFLATIAPDKKTYAKSINPATDNERWVQGEERIEYITNHIKYARQHNIPLANVYQESLDANGDGDTKYINPDDDIHPSAQGLELIGRAIAKTIVEENIFPF